MLLNNLVDLIKSGDSKFIKANIFENIDKTGYVIIFVAFLLGFFMGKTMQPVILRPG